MVYYWIYHILTRHTKIQHQLFDLKNMKTCGGLLLGWPASLPCIKKQKTLKAQVIFLEYTREQVNHLCANAAQRGLKKHLWWFPFCEYEFVQTPPMVYQIYHHIPNDFLPRFLLLTVFSDMSDTAHTETSWIESLVQVRR